MRSTKPLLFPILLVSFIDMLGFSIVLPFLVVIVLKLGGNALIYGLLGATYSLFQLIGAPLLGNWSDKAGRRKILIISEAGTFIGWIIFLAGLLLPADSFRIHANISGQLVIGLPLLLIFLARALDGLTGGNISVANAYLSDISSKEDRKKNFGKISAAANLGLIFGPLLAGLLGATSWGNILPVIATAFISLFAMLIVYFYVHESHRSTKSASTSANPPSQVSGDGNEPVFQKKKHSLWAIFCIPQVPYFLILYFLIFLAFNFFYIAFPVYAAGKLHWSVLQLGVFFSFLSGALVIVQSVVLTYCAKHFSSAVLVISGSVILAAGFILLKYDHMILMYAGALFFALGNGLMWPSFISLLSNTGDEDTQGSIQGFASSAGSLASIIGLISGAFLYDRFGGNIFIITGSFLLLIAILSVPLIKIERSM